MLSTMHWNGLYHDVFGLVLIAVGVYYVRSADERRRFRTETRVRDCLRSDIPLIPLLGLMPGGFFVFILAGLWFMVDGVYFVSHGHPMWPFA